MKPDVLRQKLIEYIYDEYNRKDTIKAHGESSNIVLSGFERITGIDLGYAGAKQEVLKQLRKKGWIEVVAFDGNSIPKGRLFSWSRIKPTIEGMEYVEGKRDMGKKITEGAKIGAEIIGRGIKGILGK